MKVGDNMTSADIGVVIVFALSLLTWVFISWRDRDLW